MSDELSNEKTPGLGSIILGGIGVLAITVAIAAALSAALSWAWNQVVPSIFGGPQLSLVGAFAILVLLTIFSSFVRRVSA